MQHGMNPYSLHKQSGTINARFLALFGFLQLGITEI